MTEPTAAPDPSQQPSLQIEKIYVKDGSLEVPHAPQVFTQQAQPEVEVQINTSANQFAEGIFEVTVSATVTARAGERALFLVEVAQAGIFSLRNVPPEQLDALLGVACPQILFPYLREAVSDLVMRGGFPPVLLNPVSFEAIYLQRMQQQGKGQGASPQIEIAR
jgi:preprotein translocase subunit SecB